MITSSVERQVERIIRSFNFRTSSIDRQVELKTGTPPMNEAQSLFADIDCICGHFAFALRNSELTSMQRLHLCSSFGALLFPPNKPSRSSLMTAGTLPAVASLMFSNESLGKPLKASTSGAQIMLSLVVTLLIIALIAGILGFGGIAGAAVGIAKIVFFVALVLFVISFVSTGFRGGFRRGP